MENQRVIVYSLTVDDANASYAWQAYLSAITARYFHPQTTIKVVVDSTTLAILSGARHPLLEIAEPVDIGNLDQYPLKIRSRIAKIRVGIQVRNSFLFVDCDTAFLRPSPQVSLGDCAIAAASDAHVWAGGEAFPEFLVPYYERLGWRHPTRNFFNSGVFIAPEIDWRNGFFEAWESAYHAFLSEGGNIDQGSFNYVLDGDKYSVKRLDQDWNYFVSVSEARRRSAIILHFFASADAYEGSRYKSIVEGLRKSRDDRDPEKLLLKFNKRRPLIHGETLSKCVESHYYEGVPILLVKRMFAKMGFPIGGA